MIGFAAFFRKITIHAAKERVGIKIAEMMIDSRRQEHHSCRQI
jgi:hypothetical protein